MIKHSLIRIIPGAALTADSLFSEEEEEGQGKVESTNIYKPVEPLKLTQKQQEDVEANVGNEVDNEAPEDQDRGQEAEDEACTALVAEDSEKTIPALTSPETPDLPPVGGEGKAVKQLPRPVYWSIISVMVGVACIVIGMNGKTAGPSVILSLILNSFQSLASK